MFGSSKSRAYGFHDLPKLLRKDIAQSVMIDRGMRKLHNYGENFLTLYPCLDQDGMAASFLGLTLSSFKDTNNFFQAVAVIKELNDDRSMLKVKKIVCDQSKLTYGFVTNHLKGTLRDAINSQSSPAYLKKWIIQLVVGLDHIHQNGLVHGALSSDNVWIAYPRNQDTSQLNLKIGGFSYKSATDTSMLSNTDQDKFQILPPETFSDGIHPGIYDSKSDIFNLGVVLWEMVNLKNLSQEILKMNRWNAASTKNFYRFYCDDLAVTLKIDQRILGSIISECWKSNPSDRPSASDVLDMLKYVL